MQFNKYTHTHTHGLHTHTCTHTHTHTRHKDKALLLDLTIVNPCVSTNLENAARQAGKHLADAVERKKNKYRGSFPATYSLLPLAMSTSGEVGPDVHALIKELAIRRAKNSSEVHSEESRRLAEGTEIARLRRRFSFVLQQALSFRTRHHLCRQGVALTRTHHVRSPDTSPEGNCTDRNKPQGREGGAADGSGERRVGGTEPAIDRSNIVDMRESERCNSRGDKTRGVERRGNGEGRGSGVMRENRPCNDRDEEEAGGESVGRKRKRRESVSPLSRLIRRCRDGSNH